MPENVGGNPIFASGGHQWVWADQPIARKQIGTVAVEGVAQIVTAYGPISARIVGVGGRPALLIASGANRAAADAAMDVLEEAILTLARTRAECAWEDDASHTGSRLVVEAYRRAGGRVYGARGAAVECWQRYMAVVTELDGRIC